ncbi:unnamed protein product, partial [Mesorhabditis belari]
IKIISRLSLPFPSPASRLFYSMGSKVIPLIVALISLNSLSAQSPTAACVACVNNPTQYFNTATNTCVNLVLWGLRDAVCGLTLPNSTAVCDPFNCPVDPPSTFAYNENNAKNVYWRLQGALKLDTASPTFTQCTQNAASDIIFVDRVNVTCGVPFPIDTCITDVYVIPSLSQIVSVSRGSNNITQIFQMVLTLAAPIYPILSNGNNGMLAISYFQDAANKTWEGGLGAALQSLLTNPTYSSYKFVSAGHSLGGPQAIIFASLVGKLGLRPTNQIEVYTTGQPRMGNRKYMESVYQYAPQIYRIVNHVDLIAITPLRTIANPLNVQHTNWVPTRTPDAIGPSNRLAWAIPLLTR